MPDMTPEQRAYAKALLTHEFPLLSVHARSALEHLVDAVIDGGDVVAASRAAGPSFRDGYLAVIARACVYAASTEWDAAVPDVPLPTVAAAPRPEQALRRIELLHKPVDVHRDGRTWTQCSYDQGAWPCQTRQILEEEAITAQSAPLALDPLPWAWYSFRSQYGPEHDSGEGWSQFRPRTGYEQDANRYPRPLPTKAVADAVARYEHRRRA
ncbi:hypothetical protein [Curtobacterium sp. MCSS17_016]|uniref:hypothetical protein n=1 Tax=Curtobacterium sp. MCSS17_016 TaxID=2175644 RepID=UPI0015E87B9B|nr:hypothetical protein [Curtobacterium sp. MCSS17_016]WIE80889.1 hypothetical protein DEJ19_020445 [Curtobacterium sp. MCSS17_016]